MHVKLTEGTHGIMKIRNAKRVLQITLLILLVAWPLYYIVSSLQHRTVKHDAAYLLYEVSLFQMELLNSSLQEVANLKTANELEELKKSLFMTDFTHERLVMAVGEDISSLESLSLLMRAVERMEISGARSIKAEERQLLTESSKLIEEMYTSYSKVMNSSGKIIGSQNEEIVQFDEELVALLKKNGWK